MSDNNTFLIALFILAAIINGLGIFILYRYQLGHTFKPYFICLPPACCWHSLAAGTPQAIEESHAGFTALLGFLFMFFSNGLIKKITKTEVLAFGIVAAEGIAIYGVSDRIGSQIS